MFAPVFLFFTFLTLSICHPDPWNRQERIAAAQRSDGNVTPHFYSYHIHVLFAQKVPAQVAAARALQTRFAEQFAASAECTSQADNTTHPPQQVCHLDWEYSARPFLTAEFAFFIPPQHFAATVPWIMANRGSLDIFVHPNSGMEVNDHMEWGLWGGDKWRLDPTALHYNCPGCDFPQCADRSKAMVNTKDLSSMCGLDASLRPRVESAFCSSACQSWLANAASVAVDCPHFCDGFTGNSSIHAHCAAVAAAIEPMQAQSVRCQPL
eukprot:TRINITY_DN5518_c0_g1_i1.p1 TRINITY_DN5518_c0_g1~~TRINITY_DN5518_c0_g1_i1.p1  ORF type:complete len:280 (-),score=36.34 TRINITY_DN5518_c0_g1_i1:37-834(-)